MEYNSMELVFPLCWRVINRNIKNGRACWSFWRVSVFCNTIDLTAPDITKVDIENLFGTTKTKVVTELFRINGGRLGYYLANLIDNQYYYCGETEEDLKTKFLELGVGRIEPNINFF
jgi:hypothetical protein